MKSLILNNKKIIITGASSGIGKALANGLATLGAKVGLLSRSEEKLREITKNIEKNGGRAFYELGDIQRASEVHAAINSLVEQLGGVDVLINNAGVMELDTLPQDYQEIDRIIDTNLKGALYCTLAVMPYFTRHKTGAIINTSSVLSLEQVAGSMPYSVIYAVSKAGINMFTRVISKNLVPNKIQVNAILPGFVDTPLIKRVPRQVLEQYGLMQPEDLIPYYAFFASNQDKQITGRLIPVEIFNSATHFAQKIFEERLPNWEELEPHLKTRYIDPKYNVYGDAMEIFNQNRELLLTLIKWSHYRKTQMGAFPLSEVQK